MRKSEGRTEKKILIICNNRGVEPEEFEMREGFQVVCNSGTKFTLKFEDGEFCEFDEKSNETVSVLEPESKFISVK